MKPESITPYFSKIKKTSDKKLAERKKKDKETFLGKSK